jgi:hypothetical protein
MPPSRLNTEELYEFLDDRSDSSLNINRCEFLVKLTKLSYANSKLASGVHLLVHATRIGQFGCRVVVNRTRAQRRKEL